MSGAGPAQFRVERLGLWGKKTAATRRAREPFGMNHIIWIAILLLIAWIVLKVVLAVTGAALHLLWIVGLIMLAFWAYGKLRGKSTP